jgi:hypothetical protein
VPRTPHLHIITPFIFLIYFTIFSRDCQLTTGCFS